MKVIIREMCGRGRCSTTPEEIEFRLRVNRHQWRDRERYQPRYNMAPTGWLPVLRCADDAPRILQSMKWGLVPSFTKKGSTLNHYRMINARSERLRESPVFRRLLSSKRCVVVMNGFYEWHKESSKKKQPYYVHLGEENLVRFAALYDKWDNEGEMLYTVSIVTTDASEKLAWMHDRMPVLLPNEESVDLWLSQDAAEWQKLAALLKPYGGDDLLYHPVTDKMGNVKFQGEECCLDIRKKGLGAFLTPIKKESKKRPVDADESPGEGTTLKKKIKQEAKKEEKEKQKIKAEVKKKEEAPMMAFEKPRAWKRSGPLRREKASPLRKSARLMKKGERKA